MGTYLRALGGVGGERPDQESRSAIRGDLALVDVQASTTAAISSVRSNFGSDIDPGLLNKPPATNEDGSFSLRRS